MNKSDHEQILSCLNDDIRWTVFVMENGKIKERRAHVVELTENDCK